MNRSGRLERLEVHYRPECRTCGGWPIRVVVEGLDTGWTEETMPRSSCPECGRPPAQTVEIIGDRDDHEGGRD